MLYEDIEHWGYHHDAHHGKNHDTGDAKDPRRHKGKHHADKA